MTKRESIDFTNDILESIIAIEEFVKDYQFVNFESDKKTVFAVVRGLEIIGEATKHVPNKIRTKYPDIPWKDMAGMRDKVIHIYFGVNLKVVWETAIRHLLQIKPLIQKVVDDISKKE